MYDTAFFDTGLSRIGTASVKWDACRAEHGADALPMWVADMDFPSPPEVMEALERRAAHPTYGYTVVEEEDLDALRGYWLRRHGLSFPREAIVQLPCVVTGLKMAICSATAPGDRVVIMPPVYGPFRFSVSDTGRTLAEAPLIRRPDGGWEMNLEAVEDCLRAGARLILLCSPHNPVSRPWTEAELRALLEVANRYGARIASDEIHADFVYAPDRFVPLMSLQKERVLSLCAPSKTFNLAGLQSAACVCADPDWRPRFAETVERSGVVSGNIFGLTAARAAYLHGDAWLDGLLAYLDGSRSLVAQLAALYLPGAVLAPIRATYLAWLDLRAYGFPCEELARRTEKAGVIFTGGTFFGEEAGEYCLRLNFGCPRANVEEAFVRLKRALEG